MFRRFGLSIALLFTLLQLFSAQNDARAGVVLSTTLTDFTGGGHITLTNSVAIGFEVPAQGTDYLLNAFTGAGTSDWITNTATFSADLYTDNNWQPGTLITTIGAVPVQTYYW